MDKEKIYQLIKEESERMHFTFQPYNKGVNFGFLISNGKDDVYGSIHSNEMSKDIYQGISKISYDFYNSNGKKNFIILVDKKENHFLVIPFNIMKNDFFPRQSGDYIHYDFNIARYPYKLQKSKTDLTKYQDNLDIIFQELTSKEITSEDTIELTKQQSELNSEMPIDEKEVYVFVTGYDGENLEKSKKSHILGWTKGSNFLSKDSLVFVFDKTNLYLDSCFRVISKSDNDELIWADEIKSGKLIYPNRWKAELIQDSLKIPLSDINGIAPFDKEPFQGLLRGNFPMPLNSPQNKNKYEAFRKFILDKLFNYWIFIVTDQPKLKRSAEEVYQIRMNDKFWGLKKGTPYRQSLKKGDKVVFSNGIKEFLGTAILDSQSFELDEDQKRNFSHNNNLYFTDYGVLLRDIKIWEKPLEVKQLIDNLSFIKNKLQYHTHFQGGIRKISKEDYIKITKSTTESTASKIHITNNMINNINKLTKWSDLDKEVIDQIVNAVVSDKYKRYQLEIEKETIKNIITHLICGKHVILIGPPGTGKTDLAQRLLMELGERNLVSNKKPVEVVASYEWGRYEVIGGNSLQIDENSKNYIFHFGCVTKAIKEGKFLLIDEFNRADMNKAFGEMFLAIDHEKIELREDENPSGMYLENSSIFIPSEFRIICTMNDYDKSLLNDLSYGLLRRFAFVEIELPNKDNLKKIIVERIKHRLGINDVSLVRNLFINLNSDINDNQLLQNKNQIINRFIEFIYSFKDKRTIGVATILDVIVYLVAGIIFLDKGKKIDDKWKLLDEALVAYLIPQFDRLDVDVLREVLEKSKTYFQDSNQENGKILTENFENKLNNMHYNLEKLNELFNSTK